ncbi:MAG: GIY-YIG nuclease family protein [Solirubrobacteraceae bacterium]
MLWDPSDEYVQAHYAVAELIQEPIPVEDAAAELPEQSGLYVWYADYALIEHKPRLPREDHWHLLYVGIAPARPTSKATLHSRIVRQHLGGNVGSSTFRLSLAALLWEKEGWQPKGTGMRVQLDKQHNEELSQWQREHLALRWTEHPAPRSIEHFVIQGMCPPLNVEASLPSEALDQITAARKRFRATAEPGTPSTG